MLALVVIDDEATTTVGLGDTDAVMVLPGSSCAAFVQPGSCGQQ